MLGTQKLTGLLARAYRNTTSLGARLGLGKFAAGESGQIAIIFASMVVPVVILVGSAIDYGRAYHGRTTLQLALDSAVLAAGRAFDQTGDTAQASAAGETFFTAAIEDNGLDSTITRNEADSQGNVYMTAHSTIDTGFLSLMGIDELKVEVESKSLTSDTGGMDVELAVVMDVTGSMTPEYSSTGVDRMAVAKQAAVDLVNTLMPPSPQARSVKVSLIPFSSKVNVGEYAEDVTGVADEVTGTRTVRVRTTCAARFFGICIRYNYRDEEQTFTTYRMDCVVERMHTTGHAYDDAPPSDALFHAFTTEDPDATECTPQYPVVPLTDHRQTILDAVDALEGDGGTAGHLGLAWGWYTLSPLWNSVWPSNRVGAEFNREERLKALIIMTDGEFNTQYDANFNSATATNAPNGSSASQAATLCENMKAAGVEVFAVGVELSNNTAGNNARDLLEDCVSDPNNFFEEHYYDVANSLDSQNGLRNAFQAIANDIATATGTGNQRLRITR
jgi:Flp pilus assembly protein TadG